MIALEPKKPTGWSHALVGRYNIGWKWDLFRIGYDDMGDGDYRVSLGVLLFYWIRRAPSSSGQGER